MNRIIYKTDEGGVAVIIPTENAKGANHCQLFVQTTSAPPQAAPLIPRTSLRRPRTECKV
jgi:hypothetical protein